MTDKTLGAYQRHESPDYADGGVTAALIEKEAEKPTAADFAEAEFARHPDGRTAMRSGPDLWKANVSGEFYNSWFGTGGDMAREGWSPVRECPDPDDHTLPGIARAVASVTPCSCSAQRARAEKAEKERDSALRLAGAVMDSHDQTLREIAEGKYAAESRPLTPEDISDDHATRVADYLRLHGHGIVPHHVMLEALTAALTEPVEDPEVVALAEVLGDFAVADEHNGNRDDMQLARLLHGRGVRVVGEERS